MFTPNPTIQPHGSHELYTAIETWRPGVEIAMKWSTFTSFTYQTGRFKGTAGLE